MKRALLITVVCAGIAHAQQPEGAPPPVEAGVAGAVRVGDCKMPACIMVNGADFMGLMVAHNAKAERIEQLERELAVLKGSKGCAKLEVTEPPRWTPKKERDS